MSYSKYLCKEKDFQLRKPYLSEMEYVEKVYKPKSGPMMYVAYIIGLVMCIISYNGLKNANLYLLSEGAIKVIRIIMLILPVFFTVLIVDLYLHPRKAEDALVTDVVVTKIYNYRKRVGGVVPMEVDLSVAVDIWSEEQKKYAVYVNAGDPHLHEGDKGLLVRNPKYNGIQRFIIWEKDTYSVIKKK
ncbi:MAG: hypothetical protein J6O17_08250 [Eubacterium sp.]|nr:hypothetical protein [Eubacterium sp.]